MAESNLAAWRGLLDELDRQLNELSEATPISDLLARFRPTGALPPELAEHGRDILSRYPARVAQVQQAKRTIGEHLSIIDTVRSRGAARPVYLDQMG